MSSWSPCRAFERVQNAALACSALTTLRGPVAALACAAAFLSFAAWTKAEQVTWAGLAGEYDSSSMKLCPMKVGLGWLTEGPSSADMYLARSELCGSETSLRLSGESRPPGGDRVGGRSAWGSSRSISSTSAVLAW
eukprot:scaffold31003_cov66-Phaeocystis_antarctica.AAC.6